MVTALGQVLLSTSQGLKADQEPPASRMGVWDSPCLVATALVQVLSTTSGAQDHSENHCLNSLKRRSLHFPGSYLVG